MSSERDRLTCEHKIGNKASPVVAQTPTEEAPPPGPTRMSTKSSRGAFQGCKDGKTVGGQISSKRKQGPEDSVAHSQAHKKAKIQETKGVFE